MGEEKEFEITKTCSKIMAYNCEGMCQHRTCSQKYTQFLEIAVFGMRLHICLCDKHADELDSKIWNKRLQ